ncbi:hypothetical protein [Pseudomaricurvus alcaniphilus]|uniref:hypothetical protein n=1 Tax=Pseudomaricurvus alcaniphilus TaxID=1166482 RepID=UPI00140D4C44|nr:hypothetical protein [Pseudomaricurvus alcaniphilus]
MVSVLEYRTGNDAWVLTSATLAERQSAGEHWLWLQQSSSPCAADLSGWVWLSGSVSILLIMTADFESAIPAISAQAGFTAANGWLVKTSKARTAM